MSVCNEGFRCWVQLELNMRLLGGYAHVTLDFWQGSIWPQCGVPLEKEKLVFHIGMKSAVIHPCARRWAGNREQYMLLLKLFFTFLFLNTTYYC